MHIVHSLSRSSVSPIVLSVLLLVSLTACGQKQAPNTEQNKSQTSKETINNEPIRPVRTLEIASGNVGELLYLPGEIRPRTEQRLGFRVGGKIARRAVELGQAVSPGQILAVLDSADITPAIAAQNSQVEAANVDQNLQISELRRIQELSSKGFLSAAALDRQRAAAEAAQARYKAAQSQLANVQNGLNFQTLKADKSGVVVGIDAEAGSVVAAGQSVIRIAQTGEKEVVISVPERQVNQLRAAPNIVLGSEALPGKIYPAKLRELSPTADSASRTYLARLSLPTADEALRWGMSATVRIALTEGQAIVIPNTALYTRDDQIKVWKFDPKTETVNSVIVKLGKSTERGVMITEGLKAGDIVVTAGANLLQAGQKVRRLSELAISSQVTSPSPAVAAKP